MANSYLSAIDGAGPRAQGLEAMLGAGHSVGTQNGVQDYVVQAIPEPSAFVAPGAAALGLLRRHRSAAS